MQRSLYLVKMVVASDNVLQHGGNIPLKLVTEKEKEKKYGAVVSLIGSSRQCSWYQEKQRNIAMKKKGRNVILCCVVLASAQSRRLLDVYAVMMVLSGDQSSVGHSRIDGGTRTSGLHEIPIRNLNHHTRIPSGARRRPPAVALAEAAGGREPMSLCA